ncbi:Nucleotidyl transferase AbiEii toxin, Type IV TA system [Klenkia marina]|uniref:Nucleotidyl transferase AbiEii toxin, Type IV TA system n=1 Tax=Klenkia marina TaxID=1960309 RepID=A0A1G4XDW3_9ACTN|nr:nucleotidyl transferase AbiEii/AbiGii toxin family protein [Klenkia marina]SCX38858.1 Nucleotidyl transferase AbiEii toxin, Type IV TA system [Klenkia marina]
MSADPTQTTNETSADAAGEPADPLARMAELRDRGKAPRTASTLNSWISTAQSAVGLEADRLSWLVASAVVVAALQRAVDEDGRANFLLKGGTYLQYRLGAASRPTKDVDGIVRGDIDRFVDLLDAAIAEPWGALQLTRTEVEVINVPGKAILPRRFNIQVTLRGDVWRRIKVEISPDEADAAAEYDVLPAPDLKHFGIPSPDQLLGIAVRFQVAQKIHACTDPHSPPEQKNDRARDVVDLLLLRDLIATEATPTLGELRQACVAVFDARAEDARRADWTPREWPPAAVAHAHWGTDYTSAAGNGGVTLELTDAVEALNAWITDIDAAGEAATQ